MGNYPQPYTYSHAGLALQSSRERGGDYKTHRARGFDIKGSPLSQQVDLVKLSELLGMSPARVEEVGEGKKG